MKTKINWKKAATENAKRVLWALKFLKKKRSGGMVFLNDPKKRVLLPWEDWFMDALDLVGYKIDRKDFYRVKKEAKRPSRQRPSGRPSAAS
jgi:hypothetical protein